MIEQIVYPYDMEGMAKLAERGADRKFLLIGRTDNDSGYLRFQDPHVNTRTGKSGHEGIAVAFLEEVKESGENIPFEYRGGGIAMFQKRGENLHIVFSGRSKNYGKFYGELLKAIMDAQIDFSYEID